jgi:Pretoxin HINT domain
VFDIRIGNTTITATPDHPFWVVKEGWTAAGALRSGSALLTRNGAIVHVDSVERREGNFKVYNFEVQTGHTYYVGASAVLVHNQCNLVRKTIIEDAAAAKKGDALKGKSKEAYEAIKDMLSRGERGGNQHPLTGDLKGKMAVDLPGSGAGRGSQRVIFSESPIGIIIHNIVDYH